jgi:hypothetical protein
VDKELLKAGSKSLVAFLRTPTGFLGFGPTYGQIILNSVIAYANQKSDERRVVQEAEKILAEVNFRNKMF